jgi:signal transduction histidine kinase
MGKLFAPFVTTKVSGVGLGLGICRRIAQSHHGQLTGVNRPSGGAQFTLTLPLASSRQPAIANSTDSEDASCNAY